MTKTIYGLEAGRGIAALFVAIYHIARHFEKNFDFLPFGKITQIGHSGVDFFFVLSGFIIFFVHHKDINNPVGIYPYLIKRAIRVFPLYWFIFAASIALVPFVSSASFPSILNALTQLLLMPIGMEGLLVGVSWTLQFEMLFYLAFALLILSKKLGAFLAFFWFIAVIFHNFISPFFEGNSVMFSLYILQFFMGSMAAFFVLKSKIKASKALLFIGLIYLFSIYSLELLTMLNGYGKFARLHYGLAFTLIVIALVNLEKNLYIPKLLLILGKSSYSIYLSHLFFCGIYFKIFEIFGILNFLPVVLSALFIVFMTLLSSILLAKWIEIPLTKRLRKKLLNSPNQNQYHNKYS